MSPQIKNENLEVEEIDVSELIARIEALEKENSDLKKEVARIGSDLARVDADTDQRIGELADCVAELVE